MWNLHREDPLSPQNLIGLCVGIGKLRMLEEGQTRSLGLWNLRAVTPLWCCLYEVWGKNLK